MNRKQRRAHEKALTTKRKPGRQKGETFNPVVAAVLEADCRHRFGELKRSAEVHCLASDDVQQIVYNAGFMLFITLKALELDGFDIEDMEVVEDLAAMGATIGNINEGAQITREQRESLVLGMDYLDALVQPLSQEAVALAWYKVEFAAKGGGMGTKDLDALLSKLTQAQS